MEDIERLKERLENIQSVEPIITSLRTIAASGWRVGMRRLQACRRYVEILTRALAEVLPYAPEEALQGPFIYRQAPPPRRALMLVIASERGLCGAFNDVVLSGAERLIAQQALQSSEILIATLGSRAAQYFRSRGRYVHWATPLPVTRVADFALVRALAEQLIALLAEGRCDALYVIFSPYQAGAIAAPVSRRWLPLDVEALRPQAPAWPPPIIETGPTRLFHQAVREAMYAQLYQYVLESAAAEKAARFHAMDAASTNIARLVEELTLVYHTARQHGITMEMLDLIASSGLLKRRPGGIAQSAEKGT